MRHRSLVGGDGPSLARNAQGSQVRLVTARLTAHVRLARRGAHVEITEAATPADGLTMLVALRGYAPPEGTVLLTGLVALLRSYS